MSIYVCFPLAYLSNEVHPQNCKYLSLHSETPSSKTATNLTLDRCSVQCQAFERLHYTHTLLLFSIVMLFAAKGMYLNEACSAFKLESPVRFRTWTRKASKPSPTFRTLPFLSSSSSAGQTQVENQRSNLYCFCYTVCCCHLFTSNNLVNYNK